MSAFLSTLPAPPSSQIRYLTCSGSLRVCVCWCTFFPNEIGDPESQAADIYCASHHIPPMNRCYDVLRGLPARYFVTNCVGRNFWLVTFGTCVQASKRPSHNVEFERAFLVSAESFGLLDNGIRNRRMKGRGGVRQSDPVTTGSPLSRNYLFNVYRNQNRLRGWCVSWSGVPLISHKQLDHYRTLGHAVSSSVLSGSLII